MTYVYIYDLNKIKKSKEQMEMVIPVKILNHIKNYQQLHDYMLSLVGWYFMIIKLKECFQLELSDDLIEYNVNNKLYIKNYPVFINLSHSNNLVSIALSNSEVGIDIEMVREIRRIKSLEKFLKKDSFTSNDDAIKAWTIHEAKVKCFGLTLNQNMDLYNKLAIQTEVINDNILNKYYLTVVSSYDHEQIYIEKNDI